MLGIGSVVSKIGLSGMNPVVFGLLRELFAAPLLFVMSLILERATPRDGDATTAPPRLRISCRDAFQFLLAGSMLFGTNVLYIIGVKVIGATAAASACSLLERSTCCDCLTAAEHLSRLLSVWFVFVTVWQSALPIFSTLLSVLAGYERLTVLKVLGVALAFAGCVFVTLFDEGASSEGDGEAGGQMVGHLIFLAQVIACAAFFVAEKPLLQRWTPLATLAYSYAIGSSLMIATGIAINSTPVLLDALCPDCAGNGWGVPTDAILAVGYWVVFGSVIGYFLLTWGNLHVDPSMVGAYFTVQPVGAMLASMLVIACTPAPHYGLQGPGVQDLGVLGIFLGVGVLIYGSRRRGPVDVAVAHSPRNANSPPLAEDSLLAGRTPISASTSHDSILLAIRLQQATRTPLGVGGSLSTSVDQLPQFGGRYMRLNSPPRTAAISETEY